ncbi:uncharacterized protein DSM5745_04534 [Aspergillus mulundensis]|uniref:Alpha/beta hydrolase fold-3 domain-containing protein n=1 Tax=Aspergillus mulundensis TaxID=1810919 RepID=A0A3D8SEL7_9EURO|nr:hypothetical protein DSM5745_04534 [Aspergillus mulundensis]RDW84208.1 hypothetical protein DSM5745_04534 [Aspergillus mulundensis]
MAEYAKYSEPSPQWTQFVASQPTLQDLDRVGIIERKRIFIDIESQIPVRDVPDDITENTVSVSEFTIPTRDGYALPVRSYIPTAPRPDNTRPLLVYLHAGGFLFGDLDSGDLNCRVLAVRLNISVLNVGYRLAPKWPFPTGVNDAYDATAWVRLLPSSSPPILRSDKLIRRLPSRGHLIGRELRRRDCVHGARRGLNAADNRPLHLDPGVYHAAGVPRRAERVEREGAAESGSERGEPAPDVEESRRYPGAVYAGF